jgi:hypothetical protein
VNTSDLLDVWFWEKIVQHVYSFSPEYFVRRKKFENSLPAGLRLFMSLVLFAAVPCVLLLPFLFRDKLATILPPAISMPLAALIAFFIFDAAYHRSRGVIVKYFETRSTPLNSSANGMS